MDEMKNEAVSVPISDADTPVMVKCDCCGEEFPQDKLRETEDGRFVCDECAKDFNVCEECGLLCEDSISIDDHIFCRACVRKLYRNGTLVSCRDCGETIFEIGATRIGNDYFCEDCKNNWIECDDCGSAVHCDNSYTTSSGHTICDDCYHANYFTCYRCDEVYHLSELNEIDGEDYCCCCAREYDEECTSADSGVLSYHAFKNCDKYYAVKTQNETFRGNIFLGIELECDKGNFDISDFSKWTTNEIIHFEHDGSLSSRGVELITQPCSLLYHEKEMDWPEILGKLSSQGFKSYNTETCGLHVHIGRNNISPLSIAKLDFFINHHKRFFESVARRTSQRYCSYKSKSKPDIELTNGATNNDRYVAVNTTNFNTIEIRIFRGSLNLETVLGTIELCHALVRYLPFYGVTKMVNHNETASGFVNFCGEHAAEYPNIIPMMMRLVKTGLAERKMVEYWFEKLNKKEREQ